MAYYIYKFLSSDDQVLYVGITSNLKGRIRAQHFTSGGHLPVECYKQTEMVLYSECASESDAKIKERYLINKLVPSFNIKMNKGDCIPWAIDDFEWKYIGFNNQRTPSSNAAKKLRRRICPHTADLKDALGTELQYDLSSAVRPSLLAGTLWLDADAVAKTGLNWREHNLEICRSYLLLSVSERLSFSARLQDDDIEQPIGKLITLSKDESDRLLPNAKRTPILQTRGLGDKHWLVLPGDFDPSSVTVKVFTKKEKLAIALESELVAFGPSIVTPEGWALIDAGSDELADELAEDYFNGPPDFTAHELFAIIGDRRPGYARYEDGKFQYGHFDGPPQTIIRRYCVQLKISCVDVYARDELSNYLSKVSKAIRQLVPAEKLERVQRFTILE